MTGQRLWARSFLVITLENFLIATSFLLLLAVMSEFTIDRFGTSTALAGFAAGIFIIGTVVTRPLCARWIHKMVRLRCLVSGSR